MHYACVYSNAVLVIVVVGAQMYYWSVLKYKWEMDGLCVVSLSSGMSIKITFENHFIRIRAIKVGPFYRLRSRKCWYGMTNKHLRPE